MQTQWSKPTRFVEAVLERFIFGQRLLVLGLFAVVTLYLGYQATQLRPNASFEKMIPTSHPYIMNFLANRDDLASLGNAIRIIVANKDGDIYEKDFQKNLESITNEISYIKGIDRAGLQSLWTPNVRWSEVTEEGFVGGTVIPDAYDGSTHSLEQLRHNTLRSGQIGRLVSNDQKAAIIYAPLIDKDPETGKKLDYLQFSRDLESKIREKYQSDQISIHITGFVKVVGDLIEGAVLVGIFFAVAFLITLILLAAYSRCPRSTGITLFCSTVAVIWQMGLLSALGFGVDPYSMLVPFLIFAIGISHGVQMINGVANFTLAGASRLDAAKATFSTLLVPGLVAILCDAIGFLTLMVIDIPVIRELAMAASLGVGVLVLTNLILLPLLMSYAGVSDSGKAFLQRSRSGKFTLWRLLAKSASPAAAGIIVVIAMGLFIGGFYVSQDLKIGDLDKGAPELRPDSRYNVDSAFLTEKFSTSTDVFVVMAHTPKQQCGNYQTLSAVNRFQTVMGNIPGVQSSLSLVNISKLVVTGMNEGNIRWNEIIRNQYVLNNSLRMVPSSLMNTDCSMVPILLFLTDHKAETLQGIVKAVEGFAKEYNDDSVRFELAAGNAGIEAATNMVISTAQYTMLALVYAVVSLLCLVTFRSLRTTICIILPLMLTSVLGEALMTFLDIGVKVATLPVIALGVGIGVDYGIYIYSKMRELLADKMPLQQAYFETLKTTGTAVAFTGLTLAIGVGTWIFSPIKFQADMGLMLTFMFIWNMVGALVLLPALTAILNPASVKGSNT